MPRLPMVGLQFGKLTVVSLCSTGKKVLWNCKCSCGEMKEVDGRNLRSGNSKSCGCVTREKSLDRSTKHGGRYSSEYSNWCNMVSRCTNRANKKWKYYGGRGISVCTQWRESFSEFIKDVGPKPGKGFSLERERNEGNYEPGNVRWATQKEQTRNTRRNRMETYHGITLCVTDWAIKYGIKVTTLFGRLKRMSIQDALEM